LLVREQATSIHYDGSCTRISGSRFFEGNQKYRGSKQFTRTHNKTYNHEERGNRRNQEGNLISGSTETSTCHQNSRRPFRSHQRRVKNNFQIAERLIQQLEDRCYECAICCQVILPKEAIWSCRICYQMFHISGGCIINWAKKSKEDDNRWRCPTCQTKCDAIPYNYFCFCGKQRNPTAHVSEIPHSCGNICGGKRSATCPHPCNEVCHPGPCPECPVMLTRTCNCGNVEMAVRCGSDVETKCDKVCDLLLECGIHRCTRVCHEGECGPCKVMTQQSCFCGSSSRKILCWEKCSEKYSCGSPCTGIYTCGVHPCTRNCHLADESGCGPCPYSPERITHCPCGLWTLKELGLERLSCLEPIPTCGNLCRKVLKCGTDEKKHRCRSMCHTGECPPCELNTSIVCRCKQVKRTLTCVEYLEFNCENEFLCAKRCRKRKSCGIHKCQELCCVQTEHICLQICNKRLSCGLHFCESICHAGQCPRCLNSSFEEQFCHCGRTVRLPPVPCGSSLPECSELCARPHRCSHPVTHRCHSEQHCPPCTVLVEKMCYGNHEIRRNVPCHIDAVSCGRPCGKPLTCGAHYCSRNCHSGDCVKNGEKCTRSCMVLRRPCEHPCALPCHGSNVCPESDCQYLVNVTCECGRRKSQMKCSDKMARNKKFAEALELVTNEDGDLEREPTITFTEYLKVGIYASPTFRAQQAKHEYQNAKHSLKKRTSFP
uniref:R3H domain-containing protein n=1 Tax=Angiostrongylus cantonensis TaxID=6313 RepID=A0A158PAX5_ANGCA